MPNVIALVLGGGQGTRLYPLTKVRSKPAVPVAGKYRLIDIPISNCINSGLNRIYVLTQFNSASLHQHIRSTYIFDDFHRGFVEILAAQQTLDNAGWYQGTADAVRQNLRNIEQPGIDYVLILSGDQLYRMDFRRMIETHEQSKADVSIAALPITDEARLRRWASCASTPPAASPASWKNPRPSRSSTSCAPIRRGSTRRASPAAAAPAWRAWASISSTAKRSIDSLDKTPYRDFGKEVFPASMRTHLVQCHLFDGYWEDIGTIKSFFDANLGLADPCPAFDLGVPGAPVYTQGRFLPPSRIDRADIRHSLVADGCRIEAGAVVEHSIVGLRCIIGPGAVIRNSILMGNDFYQRPGEPAAEAVAGEPAVSAMPLGVGEGSHIEGAIIDKNCRIGRNVRLINHGGPDTAETPFGMRRDGVYVVCKGTTLPDGWTL